MKILYHHRIRSKDGQYVHLEEMITALRALGHEVILVGPKATEKGEFGADAGMVTILKKLLPRAVYEIIELAYSLIAYRSLKQAALLHQPDVLYERYNLFLPAGVWLQKKLRLPMLLEVNAPIFSERSRYDGIKLKGLAQWSERYAWCGADYALPVTQVLGELVASAGVARHKIVVIPNGINLDRFPLNNNREAAKQKLGLADKLVWGFTGFVREWHGLDGVIDLLARLDGKNEHLVIVGDGPHLTVLREKARRLGVDDQVTFAGIVARDGVADYVAAFDIALQPAVVAYASPLKIFEYLAMGCAIVAPAQPNIMEILRAGENALLFDPKDQFGLARAIETLTRDEPLRARIAQGAHATIATQGLTWKHNAERVVELFESLRALKNQ